MMVNVFNLFKAVAKQRRTRTPTEFKPLFDVMEQVDKQVLLNVKSEVKKKFQSGPHKGAKGTHVR